MKGSEETAPALEFRNISVHFDHGTLFDQLSFSIEAGKCTCLLGPSGCGKSTLLRLAAGNSSLHYSGEILCTPQTPRIGWMSQNDLLLPWLNLQDNVILGAKLRGEKDPVIKEEAKELLIRAGLAEYATLLPGSLSGGMRQRGALLRTLMEKAQLVLMDEPFSALDALTRLKLQDLASTLTHGRTVLLVTHDPHEALRMADDILVFSKQGTLLKHLSALPGDPPRSANTPECAKLQEEILQALFSEEWS